MMKFVRRQQSYLGYVILIVLWLCAYPPCLGATSESSTTVLKEAEEIVRTIDDEDLREYILRQMAVRYAFHNIWDQAERVVVTLTSEHEKDQAFRILSAKRANEGNIAEALRLRGFITSGYDVAWTAGVIVSNQAKSQGFDVAFRTAMAFPEGPTRARALYGLGWACINKEDFSGAIKAIRKLPDQQSEEFEDYKKALVGLIVQHQLKNHLYEDARQTAELYSEEDDRARARRMVRSQELLQGKPADILTGLAAEQDASVKAEVYQDLAIRSAKEGDRSSVKRMIDEISEARAQRVAKTSAIMAMADAGHVTQALEYAEGIDTLEDKADAIRVTLYSLARTREGKDLFRYLAEKEQVLRSNNRRQSYDMFLRQIADDRGELGDDAGARRAIDDIVEARTRNIALVHLARNQARLGNLVGSRQTLDAMSDPAQLVFGIDQVVGMHAKNGQYEEARKLVARQEGSDPDIVIRCGEQYLEIAYWQAKTGQFEAAPDWARALPTRTEKALALFGAGLGLETASRNP